MKKILTILTISATLILASTPIATVNGHTITDKIAPKYATATKEEQAKLKQELIDEELILAYALKSDALKNPNFEKMYKQEKEKIEKAYKKKFNKSLNDEQIRNLKGAIALRIVILEEAKKANISDKMAKEFFEKNKKSFKHPDGIELAIIDSKTKEEATKILEQLKKAKDIAAEITKIAKQKHQRGYIGWIPKPAMKKETFEKIYSAKANTLLNKPILENNIYSVVYLIAKKKEGIPKFDEIKENLKTMLVQQKTSIWAKNKVAQLKKTAKIK